LVPGRQQDLPPEVIARLEQEFYRLLDALVIPISRQG